MSEGSVEPTPPAEPEPAANEEVGVPGAGETPPAVEGEAPPPPPPPEPDPGPPDENYPPPEGPA